MYIITGATGHTGSKIAEALLAAGKPVTVVGRHPEKLQSFVEKGAQIAVGDVEDAEFLTQTFSGATAVYALLPPKWDVTDWRAYQDVVSKAFTKAFQQSGVKYAVVLSSNGAQLPEGAGPVTGLHYFEKDLQTVPGLNILSLRAGYFMQNLFANIGMIKGMGILGSSLHNTVKTPIVHTDDIAAVATERLLALDFSGFEKQFVPGAEDLNMDEVAQILGKAIDKPDLKYMTFSMEDAKAGMIQAGLPETIAENYNELFDALNKGTYLNDYQRTAENTTPTTLEQFAKNEFAPAYLQD